MVTDNTSKAVIILGIFLFALCLDGPAIRAPAYCAGTGAIRGVVRSTSGERLTGVQLSLEGTRRGTVSAEHGYYIIADLEEGLYELTAGMTGYYPRTLKVPVEPNRTVTLNIRLEPKVFTFSPVVVTATLTEKNVRYVASPVEIVSAEEIREMGAENVAGALRESQSLSIEAGTGRSRVASLRGLRTDHTLVLIDGRRVSPGFRNTLDLSLLPNNRIERIEIVRGPSSALYGSDAVGGVINIITRKPDDRTEAGFTARYGQSKYGEAENPVFKGYVSGGRGRLGYSLAGSFNRREEYDRDKATTVTDGDYKRTASVEGELDYRLDSRQALTAGFSYSGNRQDGKRTWGWGDGQRISDSQRGSGYLEYRRNAWRQSVFMLRDYHSVYQDDIEVRPLQQGNWQNPLTGTRDIFHLTQNLNQLEARLGGLITGRHMLTTGAEYRFEQRKDNFLDDNVSNGALFIQDEYQLAADLLVVAGARYDRHSDFGSEFSPKLSAVWSVSDAFRLKAAYGEGFRAPTIFELFVDQDTKKNLIHANPDLEPETSVSFDFGAEMEYRVFSGSVRFFRNDLDRMIALFQTGTEPPSGGGGGGGGGGGKVGRPVFEYRNIEEALTQGVELEAGVRLPYGFAVSDKAALLDTENKTTGEPIFQKPEYLNTVRISWSGPSPGLKVSFRGVSTGSQRFSENQKTKAYTLWNLHLSRQFGSYYSTFLGVDNIFNADPDIYGFVDGARVEGAFFYCGFSLDVR